MRAIAQSGRLLGAEARRPFVVPDVAPQHTHHEAGAAQEPEYWTQRNT